MKISAIISILIMAIISLNCSSSKLAAGEQWKEKYGIKPGTGMLYGDFVLKNKSELNRYRFYLIKEKGFFDKIYLLDMRIDKHKREEELTNALQDSISLNDSTMFIKNIPPGEYFLYTTINNPDEPDEQVGIGFSAFESLWCQFIKVLIKDDTISKFPGIEKIPGKGWITEMDLLTGKEREAADSCSVQLKYELLNENSYLKLFTKE